MRMLEYYLMPESGYAGEYDRKEHHYMIKKGTIADMIHDSGMLWGFDYDKIIPSFLEMKDILKSGVCSRLVEWDPVEIQQEEYDEIVQSLLSIPMDRPYRVKY